jgi:uncharacterized membrane protein YfcA
LQIYLPIAEVSVSASLLLAIGGGVGLLSGIFGVGGGFLITPLLMFIGIPPGVAVATGANQVVAASVSGLMVHIRRKTVDFKMGTVMLAGGFIGSNLGIWIFELMKRAGQTELFVQFSYVFLMGTIGLMMFQESARAIRRSRSSAGGARRPQIRRHNWVQGWPMKMKFRTSGLYISTIPPFAIGLMVGVLSATMGIGGGFIMVPAMIYILGMNARVVVGTSLFQVIFVTAYSVMGHAIANQSVDMALAVLLIVGGVVGAQIGTVIGFRLKAEQMRILLALLVLAVAVKIGLDLVLRPADLYSVRSVNHP